MLGTSATLWSRASLNSKHEIIDQLIFSQRLVEAIHASDRQVVLAVTGGGSNAISGLLTVPGASRTILEARVPYAQSALVDWLGGWTEQACSGPTGRAMAMAAWKRARELAPTVDPQRLVGLACTASLATDRPKQGPHRIHVAAQTATQTRSVSLSLDKNARGRLQEEGLATGLLLGMLAEACEVDSGADFHPVQELLKDDERLEFCRQTATAAQTQLLLGERKWVWGAAGSSHFGQPDREDDSQRPSPPILFPGAFNPPHQGHLQMARLTSARLGHPVVWELSIHNVDKPALDFVEIASRLADLQAMVEPDRKQSDRGQPEGGAGIRGGVVLTAAPTFLDKARLFPGSLFVVGADTVRRIGELRYYNQDLGQRNRAIEELARLGCRFLVFGRMLPDASEGPTADSPPAAFHTLRQLQLPERLRALCEEVPVTEFRVDLRSRDLRG